MNKPILCLDPGHGGMDSGAIGPTGLRERDVVWAWAKACRWFLEIAGFTVIYTHTRDSGLWKKVKFPNRLRPGVANRANAAGLCLHINAAPNPAVDYTLVLHNGREGAADWAVAMCNQLGAITKNPQATIKQMMPNDRGAGLILPIKKPALLLEPCFITNAAREKCLADHDNIVGLARAVEVACLMRLKEEV